MTHPNPAQPKFDLIALTAAASSRIVVPLNAAEARTPAFFCVHAITGAGVSDFTALAQALGDEVRFFALRAPKALMLGADYRSLVPSIAGRYADAILQTQPSGPIHLGGWSSGALVALETARQLRKRGREVGTLVSIDGAPRRAPAAASRWAYVARWIANLPAALASEDVGRLWRQARWKLSRRTRPDLDEEAAHPVRGVIETYALYPDYQRRFMRALYDALEATDFGDYAGRVVVYAAATQPIWLSGVASFWRRLAPDCEIVAIRGTHAGMVRAPAVGQIAADLAGRLKRVETTRAAP